MWVTAGVTGLWLRQRRPALNLLFTLDQTTDLIRTTIPLFEVGANPIDLVLAVAYVLLHALLLSLNGNNLRGKWGMCQDAPQTPTKSIIHYNKWVCGGEYLLLHFLLSKVL